MPPDRTDFLAGISEATRHALAWWPVKLAGALLVTLFGPWREAHAALLVIILLDFITGVIAAAKHHRLSSAVAKQKAVAKLLAYSGVLIAVYQLERVILGGPFQFGADFTLSAAILYLVATEVLSVLENLERLTGLRLRVFSGHKSIMDRLRAEERERTQAPGTDRDAP